MSNNISSTLDTSKQTPIEIALGIDEQGRTTTKKLYDFLELDKSHYSRWLKTSIINNTFAEEGTDYFYSPSMASEGRGNFAEDYKLTATFAKKLAMECHNEQGEQARQYFITVEDKLKEVVQKTPKLIDELEKTKIEAQKARADAMLLNAKNRTFKTLMTSISDKNLSPIAVQVFGLKGIESVFGVEVDSLLPPTEKTYSAEEVGEILGGISANMIGRIAKANNIKTEEYGTWVLGKSKYNSSQRDTFRYNKKGIERLRELIS